MQMSLMSRTMIGLCVAPESSGMGLKRHWRVVLIAAALAATSCAGQRTTFLPDGRTAYAISCKGFLNSWQTCLIKAGKLCRTRGYQAIRSEEYDRELMISCNPPASH